MKPCILVFLLGFDEVEAVRNYYSTPNANRIDYNFPGVSAKELGLSEDKVTILSVSSIPKLRILPRYEFCIIISLTEPRPGGHTMAHLPAFRFVRKFLRRRVPNWWNNLKIIIKHHTVINIRDMIPVRFDTRILQNKFVPGTYEHGFNPSIPDPNHPTAKLTLEGAQRISAEINARAHADISLAHLAHWINLSLPETAGTRACPDFEFSSESTEAVYLANCALNKGKLRTRPRKQIWGSNSPLRITMCGCHAGVYRLIENNDIVILKFAEALANVLPNQFLEVTGAITWTFFDKFKEVSAFNLYLEPYIPDPFRGKPTDEENDFYVLALPHTRRLMTRVVSVIPKAHGCKFFYHARSLKAPTPHTPLLNPLVEDCKCEISNLLIETFVEVNHDRYKRVPPQITMIIQKIHALCAGTFRLADLLNAVQTACNYLQSLRASLGRLPPGNEKVFTLEFITAIEEKISVAQVQQFHRFLTQRKIEQASEERMIDYDEDLGDYDEVAKADDEI